MSDVAINGRLFDANDLTTLLDAQVLMATSTLIQVGIPATAATASSYLSFEGGGFTYANGDLVGGTITKFGMSLAAGTTVTIESFSLPVTQGLAWAEAGDVTSLMSFFFGGPDHVVGQGLLQGFSGADTISAQASDTSIFGGAGDDSIRAYFSSTNNYLRGDEGNDSVTGGSGFDDINGNMGNDTANGGLSGDWVVGGKDQDVLFGDAGDDIVYGNLGNDSCDGGDGADIVRGGQQDDVLTGGAGADWLSGDRDSDTISGGAGADIFHTFGEAGVDRVTDFNAAEGDRVQLDPGTQYTAAQVGADTVITMTGGGQMVLVGVQFSSLPANWIFGA